MIIDRHLIMSLLIGFAVGIPGYAQSSVNADVPDEAKRKVVEMETAYGVLDHLSDIAGKSFVVDKEIKFDVQGSTPEAFHLAYSPQKVCTTISLSDTLKLVVSSDSQRTICQIGASQIPLSSTSFKQMKEDVLRGIFPYLYLEGYAKVGILPDAMLNGRACDLLSVTSKDGDRFQIWVDKASHLIVQVESGNQKGKSSDSPASIDTYDDYRQVSGIMIPFKHGSKSPGQVRGDTVFTSISFETKDGDFEAPPVTEPTLLGTSLPVTVPMDASFAPVVRAAFQNNSQYGVLIEPCTTMSLVDPSIANYLGNVIPAARFGLDASEKFSGIVILPKVQIGSLIFENVLAIVAKLPKGKMTKVEYAGVLGANVLKNVATTINNQKHVVTFAAPDAVTIPTGSEIVPLTQRTACYTMPMLVDGKEEIKGVMEQSLGMSVLPADIVLRAQPELKSVLSTASKQPLIVRIGSLSFAKQTVVEPFCVVRHQANKSPASESIHELADCASIGNAVTSMYNFTVDYRHNRLIAQPIPERFERMRLLNQLEKINKQFLVTKNIDQAFTAYNALAQVAHGKGMKDVEALAQGMVAETYHARFMKKNDPSVLSLTISKYKLASALAVASGDKEVQASILVDWANVYFQLPGVRIALGQQSNGKFAYDIYAATQAWGSNSADANNIAQTSANTKLDLSKSGVAMMEKAFALSGQSPNCYAVTGMIAVKNRQLDMAAKCFMNALALQPDNYESLYGLYQIAVAQRNSAVQKATLDRLKLYYPKVPQVIAIGAAVAKH